MRVGVIKKRNVRASGIAVVVFLLAALQLQAAGPDLEQAQNLYQKTQYREMIRLLDTGQDYGPASNALLGKAYYHLGDYSKATELLEKATHADPRNSEYFDWLGKIYGKRAETSSVFTSWSYANKCHKAFERAIELDPKNLEAIDDLFEYSLNAPPIVGGGTEKAASLSERVRDVKPDKYFSLLARLAGKMKDFVTQENHLKKALEFAPSNLGRILDMAEFLAQHKRFDESEAYFKRANEVAPNNAELKFERAKTLIETKRNRDEARRLLQEYLNSSLTPDDPPRSEAEQLLRQISAS